MTLSRASLLKEAGEALYGRAWKTELAEALGVSHRYVQFMASGERPIPERVWDDLLRLLSTRKNHLSIIFEKMTRNCA